MFWKLFLKSFPEAFLLLFKWHSAEKQKMANYACKSLWFLLNNEGYIDICKNVRIKLQSPEKFMKGSTLWSSPTFPA